MHMSNHFGGVLIFLRYGLRGLYSRAHFCESHDQELAVWSSDSEPINRTWMIEFARSLLNLDQHWHFFRKWKHLSIWSNHVLKFHFDRNVKFPLILTWNFTFIVTWNFTFILARNFIIAAWNFIFLLAFSIVFSCFIFHRYSSPSSSPLYIETWVLKSWIDSEKTDLSTKNSSCLYTHHCHIVTFFYSLNTAGLFEMFWNQCNFFYKSDDLEMTMISSLKRYMSWNLPPFPRARVLRHFPKIGVFGAY